jgi:hypothetical protein
MPLLSDVWLPVFLEPYIAGLSLPWLAGLAMFGEVATFYAFQFRTAAWWVVVIAVIAANVVSTVAGYCLLLIMPQPAHPSLTPWGTLPFISFIPAYVLSVAIEYGVYVAVPPWRQFSRLFAATVVSNAVSYGVLAVGLLLLDRFFS